MEGKVILKIVINVLVNIVLLLLYVYLFGYQSITKYLDGGVTIVSFEEKTLAINPPGIKVENHDVLVIKTHWGMLRSV